LPFSNLGFVAEPGRQVTVLCMSATDSLADPLAIALARVLTVPLVQVYAVLWRLGVVEVLETDRASMRLSLHVALAQMNVYHRQSA
jgi:hypothetical protein